MDLNAHKLRQLAREANSPTYEEVLKATTDNVLRRCHESAKSGAYYMTLSPMFFEIMEESFNVKGYAERLEEDTIEHLEELDFKITTPNLMNDNKYIINWS